MKILQVFMGLVFINGLLLLFLSFGVKENEKLVKYSLVVSGVFLMSVSGALFRVFAA